MFSEWIMGLNICKFSYCSWGWRFLAVGLTQNSLYKYIVYDKKYLNLYALNGFDEAWHIHKSAYSCPCAVEASNWNESRHRRQEYTSLHIWCLLMTMRANIRLWQQKYQVALSIWQIIPIGGLLTVKQMVECPFDNKRFSHHQFTFDYRL